MTRSQSKWVLVAAISIYNTITVLKEIKKTF